MENNMSITNMLFNMQDIDYALFQSRLIPNIKKEKIIGVRMPAIRKLAKEITQERKAHEFLNALPHYYYDENILHSILISAIKDYDSCIEKVNSFLPYVDNWAVCDCLSPKIFNKHHKKLIDNIYIWAYSNHNYTCRFGIKMLMSHYLDEDFNPSYLKIPTNIHSKDYYVQMMIAWFFATALVKRWDDAIIYLIENRLSVHVHNKTIKKAVESRLIHIEQKNFLKNLKR